MAAGAVLVLLTVFSPRWNIFAAWSRVPEFTAWIEVRRAATLVQQLEHPLAPIADPIHRVLRWRLLFPVVGHALHLPPAAVLALPLIGAWLALAWMGAIVRRAGYPALATFGVMLVLGSAGWFFASTGWLAYFDSWLLLALLAASRGPAWSVWLACLLAPWVDERFVIGLPLALLVRNAAWLAPTAPAGAVRPPLAAGTWPAIALTAGFVALRVWLAGRAGSPSLGGYLGAQQAFAVGVPRQLLGLWESLRAGWFFVVIGGVLLARSTRGGLRIGSVALSVATLVVGFGIANDLSRSMVVLVPLAVEGVCRSVTLPRIRTMVAGLAVAGVALPARHVVTDFVLPIPALPSVVRDWQHPAGELAPMTWVERANALIALGKLAEADRAVSTALRLDPRFAPAFNARGFVAARQTRWSAALADFRRACELDPGEASFWFNQAFAAQQLGDTATLARALGEAKTRAIPGSDTAKKIAELEANRLAP